MDKRMTTFANTIVNLIELKEGERVWIKSPVLAKDLVLEIQKAILKKGGFADISLYFDEATFNLLYYSSLENLKIPSPAKETLANVCDKHITIWGKDEYKVDYTKISPKKLQSYNKVNHKIQKRLDTILGLGTFYPSTQLAKDAQMEMQEYLNFFFDAVSVDLKKLYQEYRWLENMLNTGETVRIVAKGTDLTLGIKGRKCVSDNSFFWNLPDGELFTSPEENKTEGYITFYTPQIYNDSVEVDGIYLEFEEGRVVKFKASKGEKFFANILDTDEGSRRIGELGIGINPVIDRKTNNDLFDEKIIGTIHIALGNSFPEAGGKNDSAIHWDLIKFIKPHGKVYIDNKLVYDGTKWIKPK